MKFLGYRPQEQLHQYNNSQHCSWYRSFHHRRLFAPLRREYRIFDQLEIHILPHRALGEPSQHKKIQQGRVYRRLFHLAQILKMSGQLDSQYRMIAPM